MGVPASSASSPSLEQRGPALPQVSQWGAEGGGLGQCPRAEWAVALWWEGEEVREPPGWQLETLPPACAPPVP